MVDVAQSVRVTDCGSEGRGFESHLPPLKGPLRRTFFVWVFIRFLPQRKAQPAEQTSRETETGRCCGPYDYDELQDIAPNGPDYFVVIKTVVGRSWAILAETILTLTTSAADIDEK